MFFFLAFLSMDSKKRGKEEKGKKKKKWVRHIIGIYPGITYKEVRPICVLMKIRTP